MGAIMAVYGVCFAIIENDARRILSYHIISQVGYMVCGVGIGTDMAVNGACAHAYAHILYKALLFMGVGCVLEMTGRQKLSELGGLWRRMPLAMIFPVIGGISTIYGGLGVGPARGDGRPSHAQVGAALVAMGLRGQRVSSCGKVAGWA